MRSAVATVLASVLALAGCGDSTTTNNPTPQDSGTPPVDTGVPGDTGNTRAYPSGPYGVAVGQIFEPFELEACANFEGNWRFDRDGFSEARVTLLMLSAGWCVPCQNETRQLEAQITQRYAGQGVRVVQVLVQGPTTSSRITREFCQTWVNRYGISNVELMDPLARTSIYAPMQAYPSNLIIDAQGRIRWRHYGSETGLAEMRAQIDEVLNNPNP